MLFADKFCTISIATHRINRALWFYDITDQVLHRPTACFVFLFPYAMIGNTWINQGRLYEYPTRSNSKKPSLSVDVVAIFDG